MKFEAKKEKIGYLVQGFNFKISRKKIHNYVRINFQAAA